MWKNKLIVALGCTLASPLFSASLTLINDSVFPLTAEIYNAFNDRRAVIKLTPNQTFIWYDNESPFRKQADATTTPYTIRFVCANSRPYDYAPPPKKTDKNAPKRASYQTEYGSWTGASTGATINALGVNGGNKNCVVKNKSKAPPSKSTAAPSTKNYKSSGFNNWSNDGGQTWTNDGGHAFDSLQDFQESYEGD